MMAEALQTVPDRDRPFDPSKIPAGGSATELVGAFLQLVGGMESRRRARKADDQIRHVAMASALILDLAHVTLTRPGHWLAVSLQKEFYSADRRPVGFLTEAFIDLVKLLASDAEVLECQRGYRGTIGPGKRTTIRAGQELLRLFAETEISLAEIGRNRALLGDCLVLKSRKSRGKSSRLRVPDDDLTRVLRAEVTAINDWIASADLSWAGDEEEDGVDLRDRFLRRIFNNGSFEAGGRLFGGFWHRKDRVENLFFGSHRAVGLDFGQMGVRAAYAIAGTEPPSGDLYAVPGLEAHRKGTKTVLSALLAADRVPKAFPKGVRKAGLFPPSWKFNRVLSAILEHHSGIKHLFGTGLCHRLMYQESCLLIEILLRLKGCGVVALPVHDGLVVGQQYLEIAEATMRRVFKDRLGMEGVVDVSFPSTTITVSPSVSLGTPMVFPIEGGHKLMPSPKVLQKRREDIRDRIANPGHAPPSCAVLGCQRTTAARERSGLNRNYCRAHVEHFRRHGSYSKRSYTAGELNPYRARALAWLEANRELSDVREAVDRVRVLYWRGRPEEAFRLAGKAPEERARIVWARLRTQDVDHLQPLAAWLAVCLCHEADPQPERKMEYRWVQTGKLLSRFSGGTHKRWEREGNGGRVEVTELHKYPASRGRVLHHLGEQVACAAQPLEEHLEAVKASAAPSARLPRVRRRAAR